MNVKRIIANFGLICTVFFATMAMAAPAPVSSTVAGERRIALVVGNARYDVQPLRNASHDATDVANALASLGFEVRLMLDTDQRSLHEAVDRFGQELKASGDVGLFYYAGHGVQIEGHNYLLPVDINIQSQNDVRFEGLDAGRVLARMEEARNGLNIVILDACRDNPFASSYRSSNTGLARMDAPVGTFIAYATAPGRAALDGVDGISTRNSVYTGSLLRHLRTPGIPLEEVFKRTRADVVRMTNGEQIPWESSSLMGAFAFAGPSPTSTYVASTPLPVTQTRTQVAGLAPRQQTVLTDAPSAPAQLPPAPKSSAPQVVVSRPAISDAVPAVEMPPRPHEYSAQTNVAQQPTSIDPFVYSPTQTLAGLAPENTGQPAPNHAPSLRRSIVGEYWISGADKKVGELASLLMLHEENGRLTARIQSPAGTRNRISGLRIVGEQLVFTWESQFDRYFMTSHVQVDLSSQARNTRSIVRSLPARFSRLSGNWGTKGESIGYLLRVER